MLKPFMFLKTHLHTKALRFNKRGKELWTHLQLIISKRQTTKRFIVLRYTLFLALNLWFDCKTQLVFAAL